MTAWLQNLIFDGTVWKELYLRGGWDDWQPMKSLQVGVLCETKRRHSLNFHQDSMKYLSNAAARQAAFSQSSRWIDEDVLLSLERRLKETSVCRRLRQPSLCLSLSGRRHTLHLISPVFSERYRGCFLLTWRVDLSPTCLQGDGVFSGWT